MGIVYAFLMFIIDEGINYILPPKEEEPWYLTALQELIQNAAQIQI